MIAMPPADLFKFAIYNFNHYWEASMHRLVTLFLLLSVSLASTTWSNSANASEGWYLGFAIPYNSVGEDFKGNRYYTDSIERNLVPKVSSGFGWGVYWGSHATPNVDWEFSFLQTDHDGTFVAMFPNRHC